MSHFIYTDENELRDDHAYSSEDCDCAMCNPSNGNNDSNYYRSGDYDYDYEDEDEDDDDDDELDE